MFRPHHDLKILETKSTSAINTVVHSFKNKAPIENPGAKEIGRSLGVLLLVKVSIMV